MESSDYVAGKFDVVVCKRMAIFAKVRPLMPFNLKIEPAKG
jgi:hypothetical protein